MFKLIEGSNVIVAAVLESGRKIPTRRNRPPARTEWLRVNKVASTVVEEPAKNQPLHAPSFFRALGTNIGMLDKQAGSRFVAESSQRCQDLASKEN